MTDEREVSMLPASPDAVSPDGSAEIRFLVKTPDGDLTHGVCPAGVVAAVHELPKLYEAYVVLAGRGEMWRRIGDREAVTALHPGRWVAMPAGTQFQYRAYDDAALVFVFIVLPSWQPELFHTVEGGIWPVGRSAGLPPTPADALVEDWMAGVIATTATVPVPDGAELRPMAASSGGTLSHCTLPDGAVSVPVVHRSAHESWYVLAGSGELWRKIADGQEQLQYLWPGIGVRIGVDEVFQFRSSGGRPLEFLRLTMPGPAIHPDAESLGAGHWLT